MRIRTLLYAPNPTDTTSLYRAWGSYGHILRNHPDKFQFEHIGRGDVSWPNLQSVHWFICQRPFTAESVQNIQRAKAWGVKVIVDYDDDLLGVPSDNKSYAKFLDTSLQRNILIACKLADVVTVSTEAIATKFSALSKEPLHKFQVIPNAIDLRHWEKIWKLERKPQNAIAWRGGDSHFRDTLMVAQPLINFLNEKKDLTLNIFGEYIYSWCDNLPRERFTWQSLEKEVYHRVLYQSGGKVGFIPLVDHQFNKAKSNIGWLELTCAGHAVIASNFEEFKKPGVLIFNTPDEFPKVLEVALEQWGKNHKESLEYIKDNLTLDHVNKKRIEILCGY